jgi:hypothetical protein
MKFNFNKQCKLCKKNRNIQIFLPHMPVNLQVVKTEAKKKFAFNAKIK